MPRSIRIGNAQAFWGDRGDAAAELLALEPDLDFLTLDYLAEVSMSILAMQRERDHQLGYARDFVDVVRTLAPYWSAGGRCRLIANAGGLNPRGCAEACRAAIEDAGCRPLRIGIVTGDDVLDIVRAAFSECAADNFQNLDTGASLSDSVHRLVTANAYLGAAPITQALSEGADIVITGRVADPSLVVAACIHHFGWTDADLDRLAGATVAGHLVECGTQVTGGISTDWLAIPDATHIGFPIVDVAEDGSCVVSKPRRTGGCVTEWTVKEQLVYEIGDPKNYLSPDVTVSFSSLRVEELTTDRVRVSGALGKPPTQKYKVSATLRDGFRSAGTLTIVGRDAAQKARRCGELVLQRIRDAGFELRDSVIECLGSGACADGVLGSPGPADPSAFNEIVLRVAVEADSKEAVERFSRELMPLITAGPQGTTGYAEGRPRVHPMIRYWPCLIARDAVNTNVEIISTAGTELTSDPQLIRADPMAPAPGIDAAGKSHIRTGASTDGSQGHRSVDIDTKVSLTHLHDIALARSGDKGTGANIGVIARSAEVWEFLQHWLTAERVSEFLSPLGFERVERDELSNLGALNFVVHGVLRQALRTDAQGKTLGQLLLEMPLPDDTRVQ